MAITINGNGTLTGVSVGGLPDGIVDTDMLANNAVTAAKATGSAKGITHARGYRTSASFTLTGSNWDTDITSNWEYQDETEAGIIGSGWSLPSSGIFSFPATGIYRVAVVSLMYNANGVNVPYAGVEIQVTTNNSSYNARAVSYQGASDDLSDSRWYTAFTQTLVDCTDTSNVKLKFKAYKNGNYGDVNFYGSNNTNGTCVQFIRLGDT